VIRTIQNIYTMMKRIAIGTMLVLLLAMSLGSPAQAQTRSIILQPGQVFKTERPLRYYIIDNRFNTIGRYRAVVGQNVVMDFSIGPGETHRANVINAPSTSIENLDRPHGQNPVSISILLGFS